MNWVDFLEEHNIEYVTEGSNVASGNINIHCPFCGSSDPSEHLGINLESGYWGCWRDQGHRGKRPHRLIQKLIECSFAKASLIAGDTNTLARLDKITDLSEWIQAKFAKADVTPPKSTILRFPNDVKPLGSIKSHKIFVKYLVQERRFNVSDIPLLASQYNLHASIFGFFAYRVIFPFHMNGLLVGWTGRAINKWAKVRYQALSHRPNDEGRPVAPVNIKDTLWNFDSIVQGGDVLAIAEGPFDSMKLDFYGQTQGMRATCLYGLSISEWQVFALEKLSKKFRKTVLIVDASVTDGGLKIASQMPGVHFYIHKLVGADDPGDLTKQQVIDLAKELKEI